MLNKDNYVPWYSRLLRYAKSKPNRKLLVNSFKNGPYVRRMIHEPGDPNSVPHVDKSTYEQIDDELIEKEVKQMEADDQAIQTIFIGWKKAVQNPGIANLNVNLNGNGNVVAVRAEGNGNRNNRNQIRCYNYRGLGHFARNYTVRPRRRDTVYLQAQLLIAQKEEAWIQLQAEKFDLIAAAGDIGEIKEVNANCILMANLQQATTSDTKTNKAPVYDLDGTTEKQQSLYNVKVLLEKHNPPAAYDSEETLQLAQESFQNFKNHFVKEAAKFFRGFKYLEKEAEEYLDKITVLEKENERLLRVVVSQDIMSIVQNPTIVEISDLQTELERTKEWFKNCIIKGKGNMLNFGMIGTKNVKNEKYDKISYDKAYNNMQHQIKQLQAQLKDLKGKSMDT
uniref:Uncharacterized protein n=1 Tax=Tanacetum cinerariifolium TaxID=118510 RepID=A0A6L2MV23_TANCI|nr:hypothetical protein [Tanacetum cinerariifolium]